MDWDPEEASRERVVEARDALLFVWADLATGYELDIIASAVVGGASLAGGRGSVMGAVLGTLIFGVLRNALPQIPGATFYDRLIVGLVVIAIVVADQLLLKRGSKT